MIIRIITLTLAIVFLAAAVAAADERPTLRADAVVTGNVVRIGDIVDHAGVVADVPVFRAPDLGHTGSVPVSAVLDALRAHALVGLDPAGLSTITVTRASRAIAPAEIEAAIAAAIAHDHRLGEPADISVRLDRTLQTVHVEPSVIGAPRVTQLRYDTRSGRFDAAIDIAGSTTLRLIGSAIPTAEVVTLTRPFARGEIIKMADITLTRVPRTQLNADVVSDPDQAIGLAARNPLTNGRVLRAIELMKPELVSRNDNVTIFYEVPGVMLSVRGKALEGGAEGDMIDVTNVQSNRTVRATVFAPGQVRVASMSTRILAAAELPNVNATAHAAAK